MLRYGHAFAALLVMSLVLSPIGVASAYTLTLLEDDFVSLDDHWMWDVGTTGSGTARISGPNANLFIESGVQSGTSTWAESVLSYDTSTGSVHVLDIRCASLHPASGPGDTSFWGFRHRVGSVEFSIGYAVRWTPMGTQIEARVRNGSVTQAAFVPGIDPLAMTSYGIEVVDNHATFYVNGTQVWDIQSSAVPQGLLHIDLEKISAGRNKILVVDSVRLQEIVAPVASTFAGAELDRADRRPAATLAGHGEAVAPEPLEPAEPAGRAASVEDRSWAGIKSDWR